MCHEQCHVSEMASLVFQHPGTASITLMAGGGSMLLAAASVPFFQPRHCSGCGYDLRASYAHSLFCPECGAAESAASDAKAKKNSSTRFRMVAVGVTMLIAGAGFGVVALGDTLRT